MTDDPFTNPEVTESEIRKAVEVAEIRIKEAENVLWDVATRYESNNHANDIEAVTRDIWEIQNKLKDIQQDLSS
jgi:hypothetical protein